MTRFILELLALVMLAGLTGCHGMDRLTGHVDDHIPPPYAPITYQPPDKHHLSESF